MMLALLEMYVFGIPYFVNRARSQDQEDWNAYANIHHCSWIKTTPGHITGMMVIASTNTYKCDGNEIVVR